MTTAQIWLNWHTHEINRCRLALPNADYIEQQSLLATIENHRREINRMDREAEAEDARWKKAVSV